MTFVKGQSGNPKGTRGPRAVAEPEESADDVFIQLLREAMKRSLNSMTEPKDQNALFANCIKFIAVTNKLKGEEGSFFDD